jgi:hypothetical protein
MPKNHSGLNGSTPNSNVAGVPSQGLTTDRDGFLLSHVAKPLNIYDEVLTYSRKSVVQIDMTYGLNTDIINLTELNLGTVVSGSDGSATLTSGTDPAGKAVITSKTFIKIQPDEGVDVYISVALGAPSANNIQEWGLGSSTDGVFFCQDELGLYVFTRNNSIDTIVRRADWNRDRLDGLGPSRMVLDPTKLNTWRVEFVNNCCFVFCIKNDKTPEWNPIHILQVNNVLTDLPLRIGSNFICVVSRNIGASTGSALKITNLSVYNSGDFKIRGPLRSQFFTKTLSAIVPVLSFTNKTTFVGLPNKITSFLEIVSLSSDGTKPAIVQIIKNTMLTGPVWVDFDTNNSPIQHDTTATALSGGRVLVTLVMGRIDSIVLDLERYNITLAPNEIITISAQSTNSTDFSVSLTERSNI